jgi:hypothetical protein
MLSQVKCLEASAHYAPDNAVRKSALEYSSTKISFRNVGVMVSTMNIKLFPIFQR